MLTFTRPDVERVVQQGVDLLDQHGPPGWADKVDLDTLDVASSDNCVLGHVYGDYGKGCQRLGLKAGFEHGFEATASATYPHLTRAWRAEILRRRKAARRRRTLTLVA